MTESLLDVSSIVALGVLRIGVPVFVLGSVAYGYHKWEEKKWSGVMAGLKKGSIGDQALHSQVLGALERPCFEEYGCDEARYHKCPAHRNTNIPCWAMREIAEGCVPAMCYRCDRYLKTQQLLAFV